MKDPARSSSCFGIWKEPLSNNLIFRFSYFLLEQSFSVGRFILIKKRLEYRKATGVGCSSKCEPSTTTITNCEALWEGSEHWREYERIELTISLDFVYISRPHSSLSSHFPFNTLFRDSGGCREQENALLRFSE